MSSFISNKELEERVFKRAMQVRDMYAQNNKNNKANIIAYGDFGTGKTRLAITCPRPVYIHSFDPGGSKTRFLKPLIDSGDIIVDSRFEVDAWKAPHAFRDWEKEFLELKRMGFFEFVGTFMLDSLTTFAEKMMYEIVKVGDKKGGTRIGQPPQIQDYLVQQMSTVDYLGMMAEIPCNVLVTGHIGLDKDEVTGKQETGILLAGKLSTKAPLTFDEKYVTRADRDRFFLQTKSDGYYKAETRIGSEIFHTQEEPDIRALLKKAGLPYEDKTPLYELGGKEREDAQEMLSGRGDNGSQS